MWGWVVEKYEIGFLEGGDRKGAKWWGSFRVPAWCGLLKSSQNRWILACSEVRIF